MISWCNKIGKDARWFAKWNKMYENAFSRSRFSLFPFLGRVYSFLRCLSLPYEIFMIIKRFQCSLYGQNFSLFALIVFIFMMLWCEKSHFCSIADDVRRAIRSHQTYNTTFKRFKRLSTDDDGDGGQTTTSMKFSTDNDAWNVHEITGIRICEWKWKSSSDDIESQKHLFQLTLQLWKIQFF